MERTYPHATAQLVQDAARPRRPYDWLLSRWLDGLPSGQISIVFPSGATRTFDGASEGPRAVLNINSFRLLRRLLTSGDLGFAESYLRGEWDSPDLASLLNFSVANCEFLEANIKLTPIGALLNRLRHRLNANTRAGSRRNIAAHYDLGNDFYGHWLDETMTYSSALFESFDEPLALAQERKYQQLAKALDLQPDDRVLEIGCGWGGFAEIAAGEYGCKVVCLTLSAEQAGFARQRVEQAGLADRVEIRIQDYRDVQERFDKVVSIEMFEAVGEAYWPTFFDVLRACLKPGGRAAMQVITVDDDAFAYYRSHPEFIQRYIFPGGMLPSPSRFRQVLTDRGLTLRDATYFGPSYGETLRRWDAAFQENWHRIEPLGFDQRFFRMWRFYLAYCEAGFDQGRIDVGHFLIERS